MKLIINIGNYNSTVIFIHGLGKNYDDFNISDKGKEISIEESMRKASNTVMVHIEEDDYKETISDICDEIFAQLVEQLKISDKKNMIFTIVAHSHGAFNAICLCQKYPHIFNRLLLISPTIKSESYRQLLMDRGSENSFDLLPDFKVQQSVIVRIHLDMKLDKLSDEHLCNKLSLLDSITKQNVKSRLILHIDKSHMIHYDIPGIILDSIREIHRK